MEYKTISFYKYIVIEDPGRLCTNLRAFCHEQSILGRVLIGQEGINAAVSGKRENIEQFKQWITPFFSDLTFREQDTKQNTYHKLVVKNRKEIVAFGKDANMKNTGYHLSPQELKELYERDEDFVIIDARNEYEYNVGHFKNAIRLPLQNFREFPDEIKKYEELKDQKVVLYCTGGIRCEKASAYLKEQGFKDVNQVKGGIIDYVNQFPQDDNWQGGLFVFDDRLVWDVGQPITSCRHCGSDCEQYINCHNLDCDKLFICCDQCQADWKNCCSAQCTQAQRQRKVLHNKNIKLIGVVQNYYPKAGVALIKLHGDLLKDQMIYIKGKTTNEFSQQITEMKDEDGKNALSSTAGKFITILVIEKVRKNDKVFVA